MTVTILHQSDTAHLAPHPRSDDVGGEDTAGSVSWDGELRQGGGETNEEERWSQ